MDVRLYPLAQLEVGEQPRRIPRTEESNALEPFLGERRCVLDRGFAREVLSAKAMPLAVTAIVVEVDDLPSGPVEPDAGLLHREPPIELAVACLSGHGGGARSSLTPPTRSMNALRQLGSTCISSFGHSSKLFRQCMGLGRMVMLST